MDLNFLDDPDYQKLSPGHRAEIVRGFRKEAPELLTAGGSWLIKDTREDVYFAYDMRGDHDYITTPRNAMIFSTLWSALWFAASQQLTKVMIVPLFKAEENYDEDEE